MINKLSFWRQWLYKIWFVIGSLFVGSIGGLFVIFNKNAARVVMDVWAKTAIWGLEKIAKTKVEFRGLENLPQGDFMVAGKHLSTLDTLAPFLVLNSPAFVFKKELFKVPVMGWYLKVGGMIGIDRDGGMAALKSMVADATQKLKAKRPVLIYPEGTRQPIGAPADYKPGVAAIYGLLGVPCVPLALNTGLYWPAKGFPTHFGTVVFEFLPAIETGLKRGEFMARLENAVETKTKELIDEAQKQ